MSARELSFHERNRRFMASIPPKLDPAAKLLLLALFTFAHDDGGGIYAGTGTLCELTGLPERTVYRHLATLEKRGYLHDEGWKEHGRGVRTRMRRLDLEALHRDCPAASCKPTRTATHGRAEPPTHPATHGSPDPTQTATHGRTQTATRGTQTKRENQEKEQGVVAAVGFLLSGAREAAAATATDVREWLWEGGTALLVARGVRPNKHSARGLMADLLRMAPRHDPKQVLDAILRVEETGWVDYQADVMACIRAGLFSLDELPVDSFDGVTLDGTAELVGTVDTPATIKLTARQEARQESGQVQPCSPQQEAIGLLCRIDPELNAYTAEQELRFWMDRCPLPTIIERLIECSQLQPPPASLFGWMLNRHPATGACH